MCRPFKTRIFKQFFFSIPTCKSPGSDGLSSNFYRDTWQHIGVLVCDVV